ncbi:MAG: DUF1572 family protein [Bacteroidota bacterium]
MTTNYLESAKKQFHYYKTLGERTMAQLSDADLLWQYNAESNSIAIIVKHLWGNMRSRWTDFLTADGEKQWREREAEFDADLRTRAEIMEKWGAGWSCLFTALDSVNEDNFDTTIYIRNMGHTIPEAINRQMSHYAYHVGQITYIGRMIKGPDWESLSIPRGQSATYNAAKFAKPKHREHFTEEWVDGDEE